MNHIPTSANKHHKTCRLNLMKIKTWGQCSNLKLSFVWKIFLKIFSNYSILFISYWFSAISWFSKCLETMSPDYISKGLTSPGIGIWANFARSPIRPMGNQQRKSVKAMINSRQAMDASTLTFPADLPVFLFNMK